MEKLPFVEDQILQLNVLFQSIVMTLQKEKQDLHVARQQFEKVLMLKNHTFHSIFFNLNQEQQAVKDSNAKQNDVCRLDVGGSHFQVTRSVLTSQPNCLLDSLFSGRFKIDKQQDGSVFIDRFVANMWHGAIFLHAYAEIPNTSHVYYATCVMGLWMMYHWTHFLH